MPSKCPFSLDGGANVGGQRCQWRKMRDSYPGNN
jgi:hypothetical protein